MLLIGTVEGADERERSPAEKNTDDAADGLISREKRLFPPRGSAWVRVRHSAGADVDHVVNDATLLHFIAALLATLSDLGVCRGR